MADIISTGTSGYATGAIDSASVLIANVSPVSAKHPNGLASAVVQIETVLGLSTSLKGSAVDFATRLGVALSGAGTINLTGFSGLVTDRGLSAVSSTQLAPMNFMPIGAVIPHAGGTGTPANWLLCDGALVSRSTYNKLFVQIGTLYGAGDGSTTFGIPDLRGRTVIMVDGAASRVTAASTGGANADTLGGVGGAQTHLLTGFEYGSLTVYTATSGSAVHLSSNTLTTGASALTDGVAHNNTQPWMALNYIIFTGV